MRDAPGKATMRRLPPPNTLPFNIFQRFERSMFIVPFTCVEPNVHMGTRIIHHDRLATSTRTTNTSIIVDDFGIEAETNVS